MKKQGSLRKFRESCISKIKSPVLTFTTIFDHHFHEDKLRDVYSAISVPGKEEFSSRQNPWPEAETEGGQPSYVDRRHMCFVSGRISGPAEQGRWAATSEKSFGEMWVVSSLR